MQTSLPDVIRQTKNGQRAEAILRSCVHCGFCNATCPTYQLLGDELDGPRGRIYLIKDMLEQQQVSEVTVTHLDRCLTCRACETTCPSGVAYGELLEIGRDYVESEYRRGWFDRLRRRWLTRNVPDPDRFKRWVRAGRLAWPFLSRRLRAQLPSLRRPASDTKRLGVNPEPGPRTVLLLDGCVQRVSTPEVNEALAALLEHSEVRVLRLPGEGCCGGLALHLGD
jgi:glycolate oxidase iron-sulfur subunit